MRCFFLIFILSLTVEAEDYLLPLPGNTEYLFINGKELRIKGFDQLKYFLKPSIYLPKGRYIYRFTNNGPWEDIRVNEFFLVNYNKTRLTLLEDKSKFKKALFKSLSEEMDHPEDPLVFHWMGNVYALSGEEDAAIRAYQEALTINPCIAITHLNLAHIWEKRGKYSLAKYHLLLAREFNVLDVFCIGPAISELASKIEMSEESATLSFQDYKYQSLEKEDELDQRWQRFTNTTLKYLPTITEKAKLVNNLARYYESREKYIRAVEKYREALAILKKSDPSPQKRKVAHVIFLNLSRTCSLLKWVESERYHDMAEFME